MTTQELQVLVNLLDDLVADEETDDKFPLTEHAEQIISHIKSTFNVETQDEESDRRRSLESLLKK